MELYLIRHADATPARDAGVVQDSDRPLTLAGIEQAHALADFFQRGGIAVSAILTSPLLRARQTGEEMARSWAAPAPEIQLSEHLAPGGKRRKLARQLGELHIESLALVGHEPDLAWLASWLIGSRKAQLRFAKSGVAYLQSETEPDKGSCTLIWLAPPEMLKR